MTTDHVPFVRLSPGTWAVFGSGEAGQNQIGLVVRAGREFLVSRVTDDQDIVVPTFAEALRWLTAPSGWIGVLCSGRWKDRVID